jgi:hypothetical protein
VGASERSPTKTPSSVRMDRAAESGATTGMRWKRPRRGGRGWRRGTCDGGRGGEGG